MKAKTQGVFAYKQFILAKKEQQGDIKNKQKNQVDSISNTQTNQLGRLSQGVKDGSLTKAEYSRLAGQQGKIAHAKETALADGKLTKAEAAAINKMQAEANRDIFQASHNKAKGPALGNEFAPMPADIQKSTERQAKLIEQGVKDGSITQKEAEVLFRNIAAVGYDKGLAASDGKLTNKELSTIRTEQRDLDSQIKAAMTNARIA